MGFGIKAKIKKLPVIDRVVLCKNLFLYYKNENHDIDFKHFLLQHYRNTKLVYKKNNKVEQVIHLVETVDICPCENYTFFYSLDPYKRLVLENQILDNFSIDYTWVVHSCLNVLIQTCPESKRHKYQALYKALLSYVNRAKREVELNTNLCSELESLFCRSSLHFHEAIQRILFVNQWLWQTAHKHNGFGHLDWILYDLYKKDIESGYTTKEDIKGFLKEFFLVLHDKCWFKSTMLLGDTGQIVILGGLRQDGTYQCNDLTNLFIEVAKELRLPDPKVLLRVSKSMPDDLLISALDCIATGIGAPFLSNDDVIIPSLIQFGYAEDDAYNYATSACWEPLIIGKSCDQNNILTANFCKPFVDYLDSEEISNCTSINDVKQGYYKYLSNYIDFLLSRLDEKVFEEDPLLTLFNPDTLKTGKDIVRGGAKYANLGLTSVGLSTVVNSLLNLDYYVFEKKEYTLYQLNTARKNNFEENEELRRILDRSEYVFGNDDESVIQLTNDVLYHISDGFRKHHTKLGGNYKFGLSSPNYIIDAKDIGATFDGRKAHAPFGVHISGKNGITPTELISFASQLDYKDNRINGNVIDFILSPGFLKDNMSKAVALIKGGIRQGFYQLQINVVDSKILIKAQTQPDLFPNLVVRVWGFSAYFKNLPKAYQDNLIRRAIEAEQVA